MNPILWLSLLLSAPLCSSKKVFAEVHGKVTLSPGISKDIAQVLWKWNGNKAAEYDKQFNITDPKYYAFTGRATLDVTSGDLIVDKLTPDDNGEFAVEVNNELLPNKFALTVFEKVSSVQISKITSEEDPCVLSCLAEPPQDITYTWTGNNVEAKNEPTQRIATTDFSSSYTCTAKNPGSQSPVAKTIIAKDLCEASPPPAPGPIIGGILGGIALIGIAVTAWFLLKGDKKDPPGGAARGKEGESLT